MANLQGLDLGTVEECSTQPAPRERQVNAYPGVDGLEVLDLGARGGLTLVRGVIGGADLPTLAAVRSDFYALQQAGTFGDFVDTLGAVWPNACLARFRPVGRVMPAAGGGFVQRYEAELFHSGD